MKMTKRIFIALLIVSILASVFAVSVSAEEGERVNYIHLLEYFEEPTLLNYDFTADEVDYSSDLYLQNPTEVDHAIVSDTEEGALIGRYLSIPVKERGGWIMHNDNHAYLGWTSDEAIDDFNIDITASGSLYNSSEDVNEQTLPKIVIVVGAEKLDDLANADKAGVTVASLNFRKGCFSYLKAVTAEDGTVYGSEVDTAYELDADTWYSLSLTYDTEAERVSVTVTDCLNPENTITVTDGYTPYASVKDIRIGAHGYDSGSARGSEMKLASVRLLGGVYHRDPDNMTADLEEKITEMYDFFNDEDNSVEDKIVLCDVVKAIKEYGFTSDKPEVQTAIDELGIGAVGLYNFKIATCVATVDSLATFNEKRELTDESLGYAELLGEMDLDGVDEALKADVAKNLEDIKKVDEALKLVEENSIAFIVAVDEARESDINDYPAISAHIEIICTFTPDLTYEGALDANEYYTELIENKAYIETSAERFIELVYTADNTEIKFNLRVDAFKALEDAYFDNETYVGVTDALGTYRNLIPYMSYEIEKAENFIKYVNKADYSVYISAKQENLDVAEMYIDTCQPDYEGVAEAKALYGEVQDFVNEQLANANAYVKAVEELAAMQGANLTAAIENIYKLQEKGNVLGVEGVVEANIKFNQIVASIELKEKYRTHFVGLVNSIDEAQTLTELYEVLLAAKAAEADASDSFFDVREASKKLAAAIDDYNKRIGEINGDFATANEAAIGSCGAGTESNTVSGRVIALVRKFFD